MCMACALPVRRNVPGGYPWRPVLVEFLDSPVHKVKKVALVLGRAMRRPKTLRFRDFCNANSRSSTSHD